MEYKMKRQAPHNKKKATEGCAADKYLQWIIIQFRGKKKEWEMKMESQMEKHNAQKWKINVFTGAASWASEAPEGGKHE